MCLVMETDEQNGNHSEDSNLTSESKVTEEKEEEEEELDFEILAAIYDIIRW